MSSSHGKLGAVFTIAIAVVVLVMFFVISGQQSGRLEALRKAYPSHSISIHKERVRSIGSGSGVGTGVRIGNGSSRRTGSQSRSKYESYWVVDGKRDLMRNCSYSGPDESPTLTCPTFTLSPTSAKTPTAGAGQAQPAGMRTGTLDVTVGAVASTQAQVTDAKGTVYSWIPASPGIATQLGAMTGRSATVTWQSDQAGTTRIVAARPGPPNR